MRRLFRTKPIQQPHHTPEGGLKRCLTAFDLTLIGISAMVGAGVFVLMGITAATSAGPAVILSFAIAGISCSFVALSYAELATSVGGSGSAYTYAYVGLGELAAWIVGLTLMLVYAAGAASIAIGWSGYFIEALKALSIEVPLYLTTDYSNGGFINLFAALIILLLSGVLMIGAKQSARLNAIIVLIKLSVIALFVGTAALNVEPAHWTPFMPFEWSGVIQGAAMLFFAFMGFDAVSTASEEAINPQRDLAIGTLATLAIGTVLYILMSGLLTSIVPYSSLNVKSPIAESIFSIGYPTIAHLISIGVVLGITSGILVLMYGLTRIIYSMSKDGLLSAGLSKLCVKRHTPVRIIIICGCVLALIAGCIPLKPVAEMVSMGTLAVFVMVCSMALHLRYTKPHLERPFKTPFSPWVPLCGAGSCLYLMFNLPARAWCYFGLWMAFGVVVYFLYGYKHSRLN